jgi:hypothetical protein
MPSLGRERTKVGRSIVLLVPILMVHNLTLGQVAPKMIFGNEAMLLDVAPLVCRRMVRIVLVQVPTVPHRPMAISTRGRREFAQKTF